MNSISDHRLPHSWRVPGSADDLAKLASLDEGILLDEIKARYHQDKVYTCIGDILIAVNPLKLLPIYDKEACSLYHTRSLLNRPPHIYGVANNAYYRMLGTGENESRNQCIVISGESGSGKTESTKYLVKQIIELCKTNTQLEQQILQINPLLEAFGNAQTVMNDNSSRFGKYIQLQFDEGLVIGAKINEYLLEKSRVVHQSAEEDNFHIFSYLFAGCDSARRSSLKLLEPTSYRYMSSKSLRKDHAQLAAKFDDFQNAMDLVGFSQTEQDDMLRILSGVLAIGNVEFNVPNNEVTGGVEPQQDSLVTAAEILEVDVEALRECLTCLVIRTRGEAVQSLFSKHQAEDARDALSKNMYGRLFSWVINKINQILAPHASPNASPNATQVGVLDIFGFENFQKNSFEQVCINLANEHLQFFFNEHIFRLEQEEYKAEDIPWIHINYCDNQPLLDLFLKRPMGILALLDEESHFPKANDTTFVNKMNEHLSSNPSYAKDRMHPYPAFKVKHYAGDVTYTVSNWLEKNRDTAPVSMTPMLQRSNNALLSTIFKGTMTRTGTLALQNRTRLSALGVKPISEPTNTKKVTVGSQFKTSLQVLVERLAQAEPHFIRCLKPNNFQQPGFFDEETVRAQLTYSGMLQTIQIRRNGYPFRPLIADFSRRYELLICKTGAPADAATCKEILRTCEMWDCHVGKTKVFLKYHHSEQLGKKLQQISSAALTIQNAVRRYLAVKSVLRLRCQASEQSQIVDVFMRRVKAHSASFLDRLHYVNSADEERREADRLARVAEEARLAEEARKCQAAQQVCINGSEQAEATQQVSVRNAGNVTRSKPTPAIRNSLLQQAKCDTLEDEVFYTAENKTQISGHKTDKPVPTRRRSVLASQANEDMGSTCSSPQSSISDPTSYTAAEVERRPSCTLSPRRSRIVMELTPSMSAYGISRAVADRLSALDPSAQEQNDDVMEDDFSVSSPSQPIHALGNTGTPAAALAWFNETQLQKLIDSCGKFPGWYHGQISRKEAERRLGSQPLGTFLIRLSDCNFEFRLSFRDKARCRHYVVDLTASNKYVVTGEPKVHRTLHDLVTYYRQNHLSNWDGLLSKDDFTENHVAPGNRRKGFVLQEGSLSEDLPPLPPKQNRNKLVNALGRNMRSQTDSGSAETRDTRRYIKYK